MIPAEAVKAAAGALRDAFDWGVDGFEEQAKRALEAAAPHMFREAKAEAWEEGFAADDYEVSVHLDYNPYRRTSAD